jgi:hypothetical protein
VLAQSLFQVCVLRWCNEFNQSVRSLIACWVPAFSVSGQWVTFVFAFVILEKSGNILLLCLVCDKEYLL